MAFIERNFIDSSGRRNSISEADFFLHIKNGSALLEGPQKILQRISVSSDSKDNRIELIHDSFCAPLLALKQKRQFHRRLRMLFASLCVTAISIGIAGFILYQKRQVEALNLSMLENNTRFISEKACTLVDEGDSYTARLLAMAVLPPNRPYVIEAEAALRNASYHNTAVLRGHLGSICSVSFSEDGEQIISTSTDSTQKVWDANNGRMIKSTTYQPIPNNNDTDISSDGKLKAVVSNITDILIYNAQNGKLLSTLRGHSGKVNMVRFSPDNKELASASDDNTVRIWDVYAHKELHTFVGHTNYVKCISYCSDGKRILSGSDDCTVRMWDVYGNNAEAIPFEPSKNVLWPCFSSDGKYVAAAAFKSDTISVWRTEDGKKIHSLIAPSNVKKLAFHPTDNRLLATSADSTLYLLRTDTGTSTRSPLIGHHKFISSIAFSQDGRYLASGALDSTVVIWDAINYRQIKTLSGIHSKINDVTFNPIGNSVAIACEDGVIKMWNIQDGNYIHSFSAHHGGITKVTFSPSGNLLASTSTDNTTIVWDINTEKPIRTLEGHRGAMLAVSFYSDETLVTASSTDALIKVWDVATGTMLCNLAGNRRNYSLSNISVLPQSQHIFSLYDKNENLICKKWYFPSLQQLTDSTKRKFIGIELSRKRDYYLE